MRSRTSPSDADFESHEGFFLGRFLGGEGHLNDQPVAQVVVKPFGVRFLCRQGWKGIDVSRRGGASGIGNGGPAERPGNRGRDEQIGRIAGPEE